MSTKLKALEFAIGVRDNASSKVRKVMRSIDSLTQHTQKSFQAIAQGGLTAWGSARSGLAATAEVKRAFAGLKDSDLGGVAESAALLGKATKEDTRAVAGYLAGLRQTYAAEAARVGDAAWVENLTGQTAAALKVYAGTTVAGYQNAFAALGRQKISLPEQLAVLGLARQAGLDDAAAGAAYKKSLAGMDRLGQGLGVNVRGENGELLAMDKILANIQARHKGIVSAKSLAAILGDQDAAALMYGLQKNQAALRQGLTAIGQNRGLAQAAALAGNLVDPLDKAGGAAGNLLSALGQRMLPVIGAVADKTSAALTAVTGWVEACPNLARWLGVGALAVLGLAAVMGALSAAVALSNLAFGGLGTLLKIAAGGLGLLGKVVKAFTVIQWLFNAALWANPITWIVLGVMLLIGAIAALIHWWDKVVAAFKQTAWGQVFFGVIHAIGAAVGWIVKGVGAAGKVIGKVFGTVFEVVMSPFRALAKGVIWLLEKLGLIDGASKTGAPEAAAGPGSPSLNGPAGPGPLGANLNYSVRPPAQLEAVRAASAPAGGINRELGKTISRSAVTDNSTHIGEQHNHFERKLSSAEVEETLLMRS